MKYKGYELLKETEDGKNYSSNKEIKSILTHEQYEKNCYKMEEEE